MEKFDLIVLGGGPAGYLGAARAADAGLKTAVIEKRNYGGVCLNEGCIPSKALLNSAKLYEHAKDSSAFGVTAENVTFNQDTVITRKDKVVKTLVSGVKAKLKGAGAKMIDGLGVIQGKTNDGFKIVVGDDTYYGEKLLIATGSEAIVPPIPGAKEGLEAGLVVTNREILDAREIPKELVVIGGGVVGLEMASYFNSIGSKVTVIEMLSSIGGSLDQEVSDILQREYKKKGVKFLLNSTVTAIGKDSVTYERDGKASQVSADMVLMSVGRRPVTKDIGLESIGVHTERGAIVTDRQMATNVSNVYAAGDVNGRSMLAHTAYREAEVAVNNMTGKKDNMRYNGIAGVIYTTPEVAGVGETEESAKEKGIDYKVAKLPMGYSGRYMAEAEVPVGICKLIMDNKHNNLIGVHIVGSYASEFIYGAAMMIETEMVIDDLKEFVIPHPTVSEMIHETLYEF